MGEETEKVCNKPDGQEPEVRPLEPSENTFVNTLHTSVTKLVVKVNKMKKEVTKLIVKRTTATKTDKVNITRKINKLVVNIHKIHKKISVIKNTIHQVKFVSYKPTVVKRKTATTVEKKTINKKITILRRTVKKIRRDITDIKKIVNVVNNTSVTKGEKKVITKER